MVNVGIIGASGFTGAELLRLLPAHPDLNVKLVTADSQAGVAVADLYPNLAAAYGDMAFERLDLDNVAQQVDGLDLIFMGLPHGASQLIVPQIRGKVGHIIDMGADFRLDDEALYPEWYGEPHQAPELLGDFVYGLPELFRSDIAGAELVAAPGCYVTTATLTLAPLVKAGLLEPQGIVVDAACGVTGSGRGAKAGNTFCAVDENFAAYGLMRHRHTPEMQMAIGRHAGTEVQLLFTPHLLPANRGILATCYARPTAGTNSESLMAALHAAYDAEPFVVVSERSPSTKAAMGSNTAHLTAMVDDRTGWAICLGALDNLTKGSSGQAIQCANLALGLAETIGLPTVGVAP
ncbi:MAG: N-acetyl-gamma-glutamyl-phosphate reductase [Acidimicrobiales bacterium]